MPTKTGRKRVEVAQRRAEALELRRAGATLDQIKERLGYSGRAAVSKDLQRALDQIVKEPAEQVRTVEIARLDAMLMGLWPSARKGQVAAVDRVLKIMERRSRLLGLDAPTQHEVITLDAIEAEIARLSAELGGAETGEASGATAAQG